MKKIAVNISNAKDIITHNNQLAKDLLSSALIIELIKSNVINIDDVINNVFLLKDYVVNRELCVGCKGLDQCKQNKCGFQLIVSNDDYFSIDYQMCNYLKNDLPTLSYKKNIVVNHMSEDFKNLSIDDINLSNEDKDYQSLVFNLSNWLKNPSNKGFYLCGDVGVGKSYLACVVVNYLAHRNYRVAFVSLAKLMQEFKEAIQSKVGYSDIIDLLMNLDFVVFDDIGSESITPWLRDEILFPILNERMENHRWTWFTSNDTMKTLYDRYRNCGAKDDIKAKRLMERIRVLSQETIVTGLNRRR